VLGRTPQSKKKKEGELNKNKYGIILCLSKKTKETREKDKKTVVKRQRKGAYVLKIG